MMNFLQQNILKGLLFIMFLATGQMQAQSVWTNPITATDSYTQNPYTTGDVKDANITVSGIGRGLGITGTAASARYSANGWGSAFDATDYFSFTLTPNSNYKIDFTSLVLYLQSSGTGAGTYAVRSSLDNYAAVIATGSIPTTGSQSGPFTVDLNGAAFSSITSAITFRLYGWGASSSGGTFSVNEFTFNGSVSLTAPDAPVATASTNVTPTGFTANWNTVSGATGYRLDVATDMAFTQMLENYENFAVSGTSQSVVLGVDPNTTYYYRVRAEAGAALSANSNIITVTTPNPVPATVITTQILPLNITSSSAVSGGEVTNDGMASVTSRGIVWGTSANPTTASSVTTNGTGTGLFTSNLTGLSPNTKYYYRAYATNSAGTAYGSEYSFFTLANTPGTPTVGNPGIFSLDITLDANGNPAETLYAIRINGGSLAGQYVAADGSASATPVWQTAAQWGGAIHVDILEPNTTYTFDVAAQNGAGVQTPFSTTAQGTTNPLPGPTTINLVENNIEIEPVCLNTATDGSAGSFVFDAINLSGAGMGLGTVLISGPNGAILEGISFSESLSGTFEEGSLQISDVEEGEDRTIYVRFDPQAGTSYSTLTIELTLTDTYNEAAMPLTIETIIVALPEADATQTFCAGANVEALATTSGTAIKWYATATGGSALLPADLLSTGTYYASQSIGDCESERIAVSVIVNPIPAVPAASAQAFCGNATVAGLQATAAESATVNWYTQEMGGTSLADTEILATGNYYVSQTLNGCESARTMVAVTVNPVPNAPVADAQLFCGNAVVSDLMVATGVAPKWYTAETGGEELLQTQALATGNYYVSQTINGCESLRTMVAVTVNPVPEAPAVANVQAFCNEGTIGDLEAEGDNVQWYANAIGGEPLDGAADLTEGVSIYYASQTVGGCESTVRSAVAVEVHITPMPAAPAQEFCNAATVADLVTVGGTAVQWYDAASGGTTLASSEDLTTGNYFLSQTIDGCESARTQVAVTITSVSDPEDEVMQDFEAGETLADLEIDGEGIVWYADVEMGTMLANTTPLVDGATYYAVATNGQCSSAGSVAVTVNEVLSTDEFDGEQLLSYPNPVSEMLNLSYSENITSITVYNLIGQEVLVSRPESRSAIVNTGSLPSGTYLVKIQAAGSMGTVKVVKQ